MSECVVFIFIAMSVSKDKGERARGSERKKLVVLAVALLRR